MPEIIPIRHEVILFRGHLAPELNHGLLVQQGIVAPESRLQDSLRQETTSQMMYEDGLGVQFEASQLSLSWRVQDGRATEGFEVLSRTAFKCIEVFFDRTPLQAVGIHFELARDDLPYSKVSGKLKGELPTCDNQAAVVHDLTWRYKWGGSDSKNAPVKSMHVTAAEGRKAGQDESVSLFYVRVQYASPAPADTNRLDFVKSRVSQKNLKQDFELVKQVVGEII